MKSFTIIYILLLILNAAFPFYGFHIDFTDISNNSVFYYYCLAIIQLVITTLLFIRNSSVFITLLEIIVIILSFFNLIGLGLIFYVTYDFFGELPPIHIKVAFALQISVFVFAIINSRSVNSDRDESTDNTQI